MKKVFTTLLASVMAMAALAQATTDSNGIIVEKPEGTLYDNLYWNSEYYYSDEGYCTAGAEDGTVATIVEAANGDIYIYNPFSGFPVNSWIKGEKAGGDTINVRGYQPVYAYDYGGKTEVDSLVIFDVKETKHQDEEGYEYYSFDASRTAGQVAKFLWKDGTLTQLDDHILGISTATDSGTYTWAKVGDYHIKARKVDDPVLKLPDNLTWKNYKFLNDATNSFSDATVIKLGFDNDNNVYFNMNADINNSWIKGTIDGNKLTFKGHQYFGTDNKYHRHLFFMPGRAETTYDSSNDDEVTNYYFTDNITFDYNPQTGAFQSDSVMFLNSGDQNVYYYTMYKNMRFEPFTQVAATPTEPIIHMGPEVVKFSEDDTGFASYFIDLETPFLDVDSNYINPDSMYYRIYLDDSTNVYTFTTSDYPTLTEDMTDIPVLLHDGTIVGMYGRFHMVQFASQDLFFDTDLNSVVERVGVQMFYKGQGETRHSKIVWWNIDEQKVENGIKAPMTTAGEGHVNYYDLSGRRVENPSNGIYIMKQGNNVRKVFKH